MNFATFFWNPSREIFTIPFLNFSVLYYSLFFALGFLGGYFLFATLLKRYFLRSSLFANEEISSIKKRASAITEKLFIFVIIATIAGARIGHLLFYEKFSSFIANPLIIFKVWEGGLASHGAALFIFIALFLFCPYLKRRFALELDVRTLFDLVAPPTAFAAVWIRLGNFFNQEILGKPTSLPWAIIFGNPMDGSGLVPRHPAQLYEAVAYFFIFIFLFYLSGKPRFLLKKGRVMGLFLILVFLFRFFIEFLKEEQSILLPQGAFLTMGQCLSIPFIFLGFFLFFFCTKEKRLFCTPPEEERR